VVSVWREPAEATRDYPGLEVHDGVVTGSVRCGGRLPLWAFAGVVARCGWGEVQAGWDPEQYGWTPDKHDEFLYYLLEQRGEFGRLLCVLADVERQESERWDADTDEHFAEVHPGETVCDCGRPFPPPWYEQPDLRLRVVDQLRRCLTALGEP
jgi:hypothetical protein